MIHKLLEAIAQVLKTAFPDDAVQDARITVGAVVKPQVGQLPHISLYAGNWAFKQSLVDSATSAVRPQDRKDRFVIGQPWQGPYTLPKTPLDGSLLCQAVFNEGLVGERQRMLVEKKDFSMDYPTRQLTFTTDISGATAVYVQYSFPGIFMNRAFEQTFFMDIASETAENLEFLTAIANAVILTNLDALLEDYNSLHQTAHSIGDYQSVHHLRTIYCQSGTPNLAAASPFICQLAFVASGELKAIKEISGGFGIIEKIISHGRAGGPIDIVANIS